MQQKKAFTLIELLVVIAVIALLMSVILPSLSKAKESARMVICGNNERTLVTASNQWSNDNEDFAIAGRWWKDEMEISSDGTTEDCSGSSIVSYIASSRSTKGDSMTCPSAKNVTFEANDPAYDTLGQEKRFTYAANGYMTYNIGDLSPGTISGPKYNDMGSGGLYGPGDLYWHTRGATKITSIKSPYNTAYFIDHEYYFVGHWFFEPSEPPSYFPNASCNQRYQTRWHKKKSEDEYGIGMIGWVDGHVSREPDDFGEKYTVNGTEKGRWRFYYFGNK